MSSHATLAPMFAVLRIGLHALFLGLALFAAVFSATAGSARPGAAWAITLALALALLYLAGALGAKRLRAANDRAADRVGLLWVLALTVLWALLVWFSPEGAYLVFPLFFLYLHLLPGPAGYIAILAATALAIIGLGAHLGFGIGVVVGPLLGAGVAILIGLGYRALVREAHEREDLLAELLRTRERLAATEREQGALAERARLAREIHDTVAQGLSSIQMLLHAAERDAEADGPGVRYLRLARETAAESLAETRGIIRELAPPALDDGLPAALRRLAEEQAARTGIAFAAEVPARSELPMDVQSALLRIAQGAVSNAVRHAAPGRVVIALRERGGAVELEVVDDGAGFDAAGAASRAGAGGSFGLRAIDERVRQLGGRLSVESAPGAGTAVRVALDPGGGPAAGPAAGSAAGAAGPGAAAPPDSVTRSDPEEGRA